MYAKPVVEVVNFEETEIVVNLNASGFLPGPEE